MNKQILLVIFLAFSVIFKSESQVPDWEWAKRAGGHGIEYGISIALDGAGNLGVAGTFYSPTINLDTIILNNSGGKDIFIAKYSPTGNVLWAKSCGGIGTDEVTGIATDINGNFYIAGYYSSPSILFDTISLTNTYAYQDDIFLVKYDSSGNVIWARNGGGISADYCYGLAVDINGNVYITGGFYWNDITFGNITLQDSGSYSNFFLTKYDSSGNVLWAKSNSGNHGIDGYSIGFDGNSNVLVAGDFFSSVIVFDTTVLTNAGTGFSRDIFLVKYDSAGNLRWAKSAGGTFYDEHEKIAVDLNGNSYLTGDFMSPTINFDTVTLTNTNSNSTDIFIAKYDSSGNVMWAKRAGGHNSDGGTSITVDANENPTITGHFRSLNLYFGNTHLTRIGLDDIFVAKYNTFGNVLWAKSAGSTSYDFSNDIVGNANGDLFITGEFSATPITFGNIVLTNPDTLFSEVFIAKLGFTTGINETNISFNANNIFPNPMIDILNVNVNDNDLSEVILYDVTSRKIIQKQFSNSITLNTKQLAKGIYLYELRNKNGVIKKGKVVKD